MLDTYRVTMNDAESYLTFLHSLSDMGAAMRQVITKTLTNPQLYLTHTKGKILTNPQLYLTHTPKVRQG